MPLYEPLNVQIKSYDFTVLETFSGYIHKTAENMGIEVDDWYSADKVCSKNFVIRITIVCIFFKPVGQHLAKNIRFKLLNQMVPRWTTSTTSINMKEMFRLDTSLWGEQLSFYLHGYFSYVQLIDLPATTAPIFFHIIQAALPEGVEMKVKPHEDADEELRYVPDLELKQLKSELDALGGPTISRSSRRWLSWILLS